MPRRKYNPDAFIGTTHNHLTIIEAVDKTNPPPDYPWSTFVGVIMRCKCVCGAVVFRPLYDVVEGIAKSCGCMNHKAYIGRRYGKLVVKGKDGNSPKYVCLCDCGTAVSVFQSALYSGNTRSCGCLKESRRKPTSTNT